MEKVRQLFLNRTEPGNIGFSSIGSMIHSIGPEEPHCMYLKLDSDRGQPITAPVAPGIIETVYIADNQIMCVDDELEISSRPSILA
jgi:hypothetical protein